MTYLSHTKFTTIWSTAEPNYICTGCAKVQTPLPKKLCFKSIL